MPCVTSSVGFIVVTRRENAAACLARCAAVTFNVGKAGRDRVRVSKAKLFTADTIGRALKVSIASAVGERDVEWRAESGKPIVANAASGIIETACAQNLG